MKTRKMLFIAAAVCLAILFNGCKKSGTWKASPPFPGLEKPLTSFVINSDSDTTILLPGGTSITVAKGTLVKADGSAVSGEIEIFYRDFHDAIDVLLAGIHMDFYSMGQRRTFQTAGMFQIDAQQNGQPLRIAEGKQIDIRFGSKYPGSDFSFFFLNPQTGSWEWVDMPESEVNAEKVAAREALALKTPMLYMGDEYFVMNYNRFLDIYLNDSWEKIYNLQNNKGIRKKLEAYNVKLNDVYVDGEMVFGRAYYHPGEMLWKDIDGKEFPKWLEKFETEWKKDSKGNWYIANFKFSSLGNNLYEVRYQKGKQTFTKRMEAVIPLRNLLKLPAEEWKKRYDEAMVDLAQEQAKIDLMAETFRSFSVNQLGTFNFDVLLKLDEWFPVEPTFTIGETPAAPGDVVIILEDNRGYLRLTPDKISTMRINPQSKHRILMFLPNNEIGVFPVEKLNEIDMEQLSSQTKPPVTFALQKHKVTDAVELREFLGF